MATQHGHASTEPALRTTLRTRLGAAVVIAAPLLLFAAIAYHPFIEQMSDAEAVGAALIADTVRWGISHALTAAGGALLLLTFLAVRAHLRDAGEDKWSGRSIPFLVLGGALFVMLPAMELAILGAADAGMDAAVVQHGADAWFVPTLLSMGVLNLVGSVFLAIAIVRSGAFGALVGRTSAGALVLAAIARFLPFGAALLGVVILTVVAFVPLGISMWRHTEEAQVEREWRMAA